MQKIVPKVIWIHDAPVLEMIQSDFEYEWQKYTKLIQHHKNLHTFNIWCSVGLLPAVLCLVASVLYQNVTLCMHFEEICDMLVIYQ